MKTEISPSLRAILTAAAAGSGFLYSNSGGVKGGPAMQCRKSLLKQGLVEKAEPCGLGGDSFDEGGGRYSLRITSAGRVAIGLTASEPAEVEAPPIHAAGEGPVLPIAETAPDGVADQSKRDLERKQDERAAAPVPRAGSKTQQMIDLLKRPEGATLAELQAALGWQPHTTRASISTAAKKGLIAAPVKAKEDGRGTVYRVAA